MGRGEREAEWRSLAARHHLTDRVRFLGVRTGADKRWLLQNCRFGVMPSVEEGHPVVGLEYLATGRPVVCTTLGAFDDMFEHEQNAWRVPPRDPDALAHAIAAAAALSPARAADIRPIQPRPRGSVRLAPHHRPLPRRVARGTVEVIKAPRNGSPRRSRRR